MTRKALLFLVLSVMLIVAMSITSLADVWAEINTMTLTNNTCTQATVTVNFTGNGNGEIQFWAELTDGAVGASTRISTTITVNMTPPTAATTPATVVAFTTAQAEGTVIRIVANQADVNSQDFREYTCSGTTGSPSPTPTTGTGATPTYTPTVVDALQREAQQGVVRLYDDFHNAVVFRLSNGDVQFWHLPEGVFVGHVPVFEMNPAHYTPGQLIRQFTAVDGWRVDFFYHGWATWRAIFYDAAGNARADVYFDYGDPNTGQPPNPNPPDPNQLAQQQGQGGGGLVFPGIFQPLQPAPVNLFPFVPVVLPQPQLQPAIGNFAQIQPIPSGGSLVVIVRVSLSVRSGPSLASARIGVVAPGTQITLQARDVSGLWAYGVASNGMAGWMATRYLSANLAQILGLPAAQ